MEAGQIIPEVLGNASATIGIGFSEHRQYWMPWLSDLKAARWHRPLLAVFVALVLLHAIVPATPAPGGSGCFSHDGVIWKCFDASGRRTS